MAFLTISLGPDLSAREHRRAVRAGPPAVSGREDSATLLRRAGFEAVSVTDVTDQYLHTARGGLLARDRLRDRLVQDDGSAFERDQRRRRSAVAAIEAGWLRRQLLTASRPL